MSNCQSSGRDRPTGAIASSRPPAAERARDVERGAVVRFTFDGRPVEAFAGESVAAAALAAGVRVLRRSPCADEPRGPFCWMGSCQECTVVVDGVRRPACRTPVADGLVVETGTV